MKMENRTLEIGRLGESYKLIMTGELKAILEFINKNGYCDKTHTKLRMLQDRLGVFNALFFLNDAHGEKIN